jgi:hypothetical protein
MSTDTLRILKKHQNVHDIKKRLLYLTIFVAFVTNKAPLTKLQKDNNDVYI